MLELFALDCKIFLLTLLLAVCGTAYSNKEKLTCNKKKLHKNYIKQ